MARVDRSWTARLDSLRVFWYRRIVSFDDRAQAEALRAVGADVIVADLASEAWHRELPSVPRWVVNTVSSGGGGVEGYRKSYVDGTSSLVRWAEAAGGASAPPPVLALRDVVVAYGALRAIDGVSLALRPGQVISRWCPRC